MIYLNVLAFKLRYFLLSDLYRTVYIIVPQFLPINKYID